MALKRTVGALHDQFVWGRQVRVLADHLASLVPPQARVLDIGYGDGTIDRLIKTKLPAVTIEGIDVLVSPDARISVKAFDGTRIPYPDGSFDAALLIDVLHHASDPVLLLEEASRVAKSVIIKDHFRQGTLAGLRLRLMDWIGNAPHGVRLPYHSWSACQWNEALMSVGLEAQEAKTSLGLYPAPVSWIFENRLHFIGKFERIAEGKHRLAGMPKTLARATVPPPEPLGNSRKKNIAQIFDEYVGSYESTLSDALRVSGEGRRYFAEGRVLWLRRRLREVGCLPQRILDFGCGDGSTTPLLLESFNSESAVGTDISQESIKTAKAAGASEKVAYAPLEEFRPDGQMDLAYCSGVFHHIPPSERDGALALVKEALRPGGWFGYWENNPWNPATRYVMANCAFDCDAITLTPAESRRLLRKNGFEVVRTDYRFIFPRVLKWLRKTEDVLSRAPLGTQYMVLCRKPE